MREGEVFLSHIFFGLMPSGKVKVLGIKFQAQKNQETRIKNQESRKERIEKKSNDSLLCETPFLTPLKTLWLNKKLGSKKRKLTCPESNNQRKTESDKPLTTKD